MPVLSGWAAKSGTELFTIGWVEQLPAVITPPPPPIGGGTKRSRRQVPGITGNRSIAMREDEEVLAMLEAYFNTKRH